MEEFTESVYQKYGFEDTKLHHNGYRWFKNIYWKRHILLYMFREIKSGLQALPKIQDFWEKVISERKVPNRISNTRQTRASNKPKEQKESDVIVLG